MWYCWNIYGWNTQLHPRPNVLADDSNISWGNWRQYSIIPFTFCKSQARLAAKQTLSIFPPIMLDGTYSVLGVKEFTLSPPNILVIVVKQLNFCFIWPQNFPPKDLFFVKVISSKLQSSLKVATSGGRAASQPTWQGILTVQGDVKQAWLWTLTPGFWQILIHCSPAFWWFLVDSWPSWPIAYQQQVIAYVFFLFVAASQMCHALYTYNCLHYWFWDP